MLICFFPMSSKPSNQLSLLKIVIVLTILNWPSCPGDDSRNSLLWSKTTFFFFKENSTSPLTECFTMGHVFQNYIPFCSAKMSADYKHPCLSGVPQKNISLAMCGHHKAKQDLLLCGDDCKHLSNDIHNCVTFLATTSQWLPDAFSQGTGFKGRKARQLLGSWFLPSQSLHSFLLLIPFASPHMWHCPLLSNIS